MTAVDGKAKETKRDFMFKHIRNAEAARKKHVENAQTKEKNDQSQTMLSELIAFIIDQDFDSECIESDIDIYKTTKKSNLPMLDAVIAFIRDHRLSTHTFSTGIVFWY